MNCTGGGAHLQDVTAFIAAAASVLASLLLFAQFYVDHRRALAAGQPSPGTILASAITPKPSAENLGPQ
jgi:hypothetical protein